MSVRSGINETDVTMAYCLQRSVPVEHITKVPLSGFVFLVEADSKHRQTTGSALVDHGPCQILLCNFALETYTTWSPFRSGRIVR